MSVPEKGYLLIADITGYTQFLRGSELEHAQGILQTLLELLIQHTRPPLVISRLAGDAVISYGLQDQFLSGQTFVEMIEDTYVAFRRAIDLMVLNTSCGCNACANISTLDLKFFVHHGSFIRQRLDQHDELLGEDVILIHRLLKNHITQERGLQAYSLYTTAALESLGLEGLETDMIAHRESYEDMGEVEVWVQDMHPIWEEKRGQVRIRIAPDDVLAYVAGEFPLPAPVMWDVVTDPEYRAFFMSSEGQSVHNRKGGRLAPGSVYECYHGESRVSHQTILEWQPFEQMTTEDTMPFPGVTSLTNVRLTPVEGRTRVEFTCSKARGPWHSRWIANLGARFIVQKQFRVGMRLLSERLETERAEGKRILTEGKAISAAQVGEAASASLRGE